MKKSLFIAVTVLAFVSSRAFAQMIPRKVIPQLITIQKQDVDSGKRLQREQQRVRDYKKRQEDKAQVTRELLQKREKLIERIRPSEYKIKSVYIKKIELSENEILTQEEIADIVKDYENTKITSASVKELIGRIDEVCVDKGYITSWAYLPKQNIKDGLLKIAIEVGKVGQVKIEGNRWTKEAHIRSRLDMKEGEIFNLQKLVENMVIYNRYNEGITITGDLNPSEKEGATNIDITVEERVPYHVMTVVDNYSHDTIGRNCAGVLFGQDSLFGYRDKLFGGMFANSHSKTPFIEYDIPVNKKDGRVGVSFSHNEAEIGHGPGKDFNIESRTQNYSIFYTHPFIHELHEELNAKTSYTYKRSITSVGGKNLHDDKIPELKADINYRRDTTRGVWYFAQSISYAAPWYQDIIDYFKFEGSVTRLHDFGHRILGQFQGSYQYVPKDNVPFVDQMSAGGFGSVRGYAPDVMIIAKSGYQLNAEIYFPVGAEEFRIGDKTYRTDDYVRPFVFTDYAALYPYKGEGANGEHFNKNDILFSSGLGLRVQLPHNIVLKATYGVPLRHNKFDDHHNGNWNLEIRFSPDLSGFFKR